MVIFEVCVYRSVGINRASGKIAGQLPVILRSNIVPVRENYIRIS